MKAIIKMLLNLLRPAKRETPYAQQLDAVRREREEAERLLGEAQASLNGEQNWFKEIRDRQVRNGGANHE